MSKWGFAYATVTQLFIFYYSVIDYSVYESIINYRTIRNWLFGDHLFCNGIDKQLFVNVWSLIIC